MTRTNQYVNIWGLRVLDQGKITCKGPEAGWSLVFFRFRKNVGFKFITPQRLYVRIIVSLL